MYYVYEIPGVKIGCTKDLKGRMRAQGFTSWRILEEHTDAQTAGDRELELQKEKGYPIDTSHYTHSIAMLEIRRSKANLTKEHFSRIGKIGGAVKNNTFENYSKAGKKGGSVTGNLTAICPHCNKTGKMMPMKRWHFDNCKHK